MNKIKWPLLLTAGAALVYLAYNQVTGLGNILVNFRRLRFLGISIGGTQLAVDLEATNPTAIPAIIQHILGSIFLDGREIGTLNGLNRNLTIQPNATTPITIPVNLSNIDLGFALSKLQLGQQVRVDYKVVSPVGNIEGSKSISIGI
jgi:LEA14-like dessication related protein